MEYNKAILGSSTDQATAQPHRSFRDAAPPSPRETIGSQIASFDPMLAAAHEFAVRFGGIADRLFGAIPAEANSKNDGILGNDNGPVVLQLERRKGELQRSLNLMADALGRLESQI